MLLSRRHVFQAGGALLLSRCAQPFTLQLDSGASYDEVLDALHLSDFEFRNGLSNHAPMAAEALVAMGRPDRVVPFIQGYVKNLEGRSEAQPLTESERAAALGKYEKREEWAATYEKALETMSPQALLQQELPTLAPGWIAAGWHGLLRTAHAVRAVQREDTPARRRELAQGLAFWASRHTTPIPGTPGATPEAGLDVVSALKRVTPLSSSEQVRGGLIEPRFEPLRKHPEFATSIEAVDLNAQPVDRALSELVAAAARLQVNVNAKDIAFLHGVTGTSALRLMLPWLDAANQRLALGYAFQTVAGLFAAQASSASQFDPVADPTVTAQALLEESTESADEHAIKLTEAAVREFAISGKPELLTAAEGY